MIYSWLKPFNPDQEKEMRQRGLYQEVQAPEGVPENDLNAPPPTIGSGVIKLPERSQNKYGGGMPPPIGSKDFDPINPPMIMESDGKMYSKKPESFTIDDERIDLYSGSEPFERPAPTGMEDTPVVGGMLDFFAGVGAQTFRGGEQILEGIGAGGLTESTSEDYDATADYYYHKKWIPEAASHVLNETGEKSFKFDLRGDKRLGIDTQAKIGISDSFEEVEAAIKTQYPDADVMIVGGEETLTGKDYIWRPNKDEPWSYTIDRTSATQLIARGGYEGAAAAATGYGSYGAVKLAAQVPGPMKVPLVGAAFVGALFAEGWSTNKVRQWLQTEAGIQMDDADQQALEAMQEGEMTALFGTGMVGGAKIMKFIPDFFKAKLMDRHDAGIKLIDAINTWAKDNNLPPLLAHQVTRSKLLQRMARQWMQISHVLPDYQREQMQGVMEEFSKWSGRPDVLEDVRGQQAGTLFGKKDQTYFDLRGASAADLEKLRKEADVMRNVLLGQIKRAGPVGEMDAAGKAVVEMLHTYDMVMTDLTRAMYKQLDDILPPKMITYDTTSLNEAMGDLRGYALTLREDGELSSGQMSGELLKIFHMGEDLGVIGGKDNTFNFGKLSKAKKDYEKDFGPFNPRNPREVLMYYKKRLGDFAFSQDIKTATPTQREHIQVARDMYNAVDEVLKNPVTSNPANLKQYQTILGDANKIWSDYEKMKAAPAYREFKRQEANSEILGSSFGRDPGSLVRQMADNPTLRDLSTIKIARESIDFANQEATRRGITLGNYQTAEGWKEVQAAVRGKYYTQLLGANTEDAKVATDQLLALKNNSPEVADMIYGPGQIDNIIAAARGLDNMNRLNVDLRDWAIGNPTMMDAVNEIMGGSVNEVRRRKDMLDALIKQNPEVEADVSKAIKQSLMDQTTNMGVISSGRTSEGLMPYDLSVDLGKFKEKVGKLRESGLFDYLSKEDKDWLKMLETYSQLTRSGTDAGSALVGAQEISQLQKANFAALWTLFRSRLASEAFKSGTLNKYLMAPNTKFTVEDHAVLFGELSALLSDGDTGATLEGGINLQGEEVDIFPTIPENMR